MVIFRIQPRKATAGGACMQRIEPCEPNVDPCHSLFPGGRKLLSFSWHSPIVRLVLFGLYDSPKEDATVLLRHSSLHHETLNQLPILRQRLTIPHGHTARIQNLVDNETEAVRSKSAVLQQEIAILEPNMTTHIDLVIRSEWRDGMVKSFDHFLMHIPKTGCTHARIALTESLIKYPQLNRLLPSNRYRACDVGTAPLRIFPKFNYQYKGFRCTIWMSEQPYSDTPMHTYTSIAPRPRLVAILPLYRKSTA
jgi:hypothetical protein